MKTYIPNKRILENYAKVLVHFGIGEGKGLKKGEVVRVVLWESAKPLLPFIQKEIYKKGGHIILSYIPDEMSRFFMSREVLQQGGRNQLTYYPEKYYQGIIDEIDHELIVSTSQVGVFADCDISAQSTFKSTHWRYLRTRSIKEDAGHLSWTLAVYPTEAMAKQANMSLQQYWNQIIKACFLKEADPVKTWREKNRQIKKFEKKLNSLNIERLHIKSKNIDLWITLSPKSAWMSGSGANIPSFEIFTSPDWRGTEGAIYFDSPLMYQGNRLEGIQLEFKKGKVVGYSAKKGKKILDQFFKTKNADKVGEFSLTDIRHSHIDRFMANTLFDENFGGKYGNTHIALGAAYRDKCYKGDGSLLSEQDWEDLGYNNSDEHTDIFSTENRIVTAHWDDGRKKVIYKDGKFSL